MHAGSLAIALVWLAYVCYWRHKLSSVPDLTRTAPPFASSEPGRITVVVPARNEAAHIAATLQSLMRAEGVALQIIAVNDRSTDATGTVMDQVMDEVRQHGTAPATSGTTLEVLHIKDLPPGWLGKTHAMAQAAKLAREDWLLFTDADILFAPTALRRALAFAQSSNADHMVLMPTVLLQTPGERMMIAFLQVMSIWAVRLWLVPDPRSRGNALGIGAFNLLRRKTYDALGGWQVLRLEVLEDLTLGRKIKQSGFNQRVALGRDLVTVRWAAGAFGVVQGLSKNLFALCRFRVEVVLVVVVLLAVFTLLPFVTWPSAAIMSLALLLAYDRTGKYHHFTALQAILFPIASLLFLYALLRSMLLALWRRGVTWRGTFYPLNELRHKKS